MRPGQVVPVLGRAETAPGGVMTDFGTCPDCGTALDPDGLCRTPHPEPDAEVVPMPEPDASPSGSLRQRGRKRNTSRPRQSSAAAPRPAVRAVPSDPARLLHDLHGWLTGYVAFPSRHAAVAVTLWIVHTHLAGCFDSTGRLVLLSPEPECGKSRVLELAALTCAGAEFLNDASAAYLFRRIGGEDAGPVTLLLDEADAIWKRKGDENAEAVRSILNAGHRKGASVGRAENHGAALTRFRVYAPAAIAAKGDPLPDTIMSRAIVVHMRRRAPDQQVRRYRERITGPEGEPLHGKLAAWAASVAGKVGDPWPDMPEGVEDRPADVWEPLIMVADLAGGDWPDLARSACVALVKGARDDSQTTGTRLLADLRKVFGDAEALSTETILGKLRGLDESAWDERLTSRSLARLLRHYEVKPRVVRLGDSTPRGYRAEDLADAWHRYLTSPSATSATSATSLTSHVADVALVADREPRCAACGQPMDPALTGAGYATHPGCDPEEEPPESAEQPGGHVAGVRDTGPGGGRSG
jgi:hypothetical protein